MAGLVDLDLVGERLHLEDAPAGGVGHADPSRELLAYYRLAAETRVQYRLIARWLSSAAS